MKKEMVILLFVLFSSFAIAATYYNCPPAFDTDTEVLYVTGKGMFLYLRNPPESPSIDVAALISPITRNELHDLIDFYLQGGDCNTQVANSKSGNTIIKIANKIENVGYYSSGGSSCNISGNTISSGSCYYQYYCSSGTATENCTLCSGNCSSGSCDAVTDKCISAPLPGMHIELHEDRVIKDALLKHITAEIGDSNFTHLNISNNAPYDKLVGYWNFDAEPTGTTGETYYDYSGNGHDLTGNADSTTSSGGIYGNYGQTDGNGDDIYASSHADFNFDEGLMTLSGWFNCPTGDWTGIWSFNGGGQYIKHHGNSFDMDGYIWDGSDIQKFNINGNSKTDGVWYHLAWTFNLSNDLITITGYHNSNIVNSWTSSTDYDFSGNWNFKLGESNNNNADCQYDEIMVFNTFLTAQQISDIYNNQSARFKTTGTQILDNQRYLNISSGYNTINVTANFQANFKSRISLIMGYYDGSWHHTAPQNITGYNSFTISGASTNLTLNFTLHAGSAANPFYTPVLRGDINLTA
ncbi:hypothetical protein GF323_00550 [Candidatus Woesearchaeota archaeon]|nr:hypothetical protein [Candidatus Woesearchaeota archaeon]